LSDDGVVFAQRETLEFHKTLEIEVTKVFMEMTVTWSIINSPKTISSLFGEISDYEVISHRTERWMSDCSGDWDNAGRWV